MRIALVCPYSYDRPGGVQAHVRGLARELGRRGHAVDVLAPADDGVSANGFVPVGRSVSIPDNASIVPVALSPRTPGRVAHLLRERRYDVVHVHEPMIPAVSLTALLSAGQPLVGTFHRYARRPGWYRVFAPLCRSSLERLDVRIAVSEAARRHVSRTCPGEYRVIPNGVDTKAFPRLISERSGRRVLFVGRADERKGLPILLEAFRRLPRCFELELVGVDVSDLRGTSLERIVVHGRVGDDDRDRLLARADVLCVPSLEAESFGVVLLEGMAAGVPVVASGLPGYADLLPPSAGRLVRPGDADALAAALREVLEDPALRKRMGDAGRRAAARYDWSTIADEVLETYADARARHLARTSGVVAPVKAGHPRAERPDDGGDVARATEVGTAKGRPSPAD